MPADYCWDAHLAHEISTPQRVSLSLVRATCEHCGYILKKTKLHFDKLPDILVIQIARMGKEGTFVDETPI